MRGKTFAINTRAGGVVYKGEASSIFDSMPRLEPLMLTEHKVL